MMDCENLHLLREEPIDDPITLNNKLADVLPADLRDNTTQPGKLRQTIRYAENTIGKYLRVSRSIAGNEETYRLKVIQRLVRPAYLSHFAIRRRASSCDIFCPLSACAMPRSTLWRR